MVYRRYAGYATSSDPTDVWVPGEIIPAMTAKAHQYPNQRSGLIAIDTLNCDRLEVKAINIPAGVTDLYLKFYGLTEAGQQPRVSNHETVIASSNFRPLHTQVGHSDFDFVDGGTSNEAVAFTDTAGRTAAALTVGAKYHIWASQDCYVASGNGSVDATTSDYALPKNQVREYIPQTNRDYISAIRVATSGTIYVSKANSYLAES
jgi:hypothetical protein